MYVLPDMQPSFVTDNILRGLHDCSKSTISRLRRKGVLEIDEKLPTLTHRSLRCAGLDEYGEATGLPLCYFFYGTHTPPTPTYTPFDGAVIALLNFMSNAQLAAFKECLYLFFPNAFVDLEEDNFRIRAIKAMRYRIPCTNVENPTDYASYKKIDDISLAASLKQYGSRKSDWIRVDSLVDISTYIGVSLHWILNIKNHPLYCKNTLAEEVFNYYTLLPQHQWRQFLDLLWFYYGGSYAKEYLKSL